MEFDLESAINATAETPRAALMEVLAVADDIEDIYIVCAMKDSADGELSGVIWGQSNTRSTYKKLGLVHQAMFMLEDLAHAE
jgi:hypothetical protein